jgi:hypothetical protein
LKVGRGLAFIILSGEPVFVNSIETTEAGFLVARTTRGVMGQDGINYRSETFPVEQLETRYSQLKRGVETDVLLMDLREAADEKRYSLSPQQAKTVLQAVNPSHLN